MNKNYDVITFILQNTIILKKPRAANFVGIIKIATLFIKTTCKDLKKLKELEIRCNLYPYLMIL